MLETGSMCRDLVREAHKSPLAVSGMGFTSKTFSWSSLLTFQKLFPLHLRFNSRFLEAFSCGRSGLKLSNSELVRQKITCKERLANFLPRGACFLIFESFPHSLFVKHQPGNRLLPHNYLWAADLSDDVCAPGSLFRWVMSCWIFFSGELSDLPLSKLWFQRIFIFSSRVVLGWVICDLFII